MASLSFETWQIHNLCLFEWLINIELIWLLAKQTKTFYYYRFASFLITFIFSALCIFNWHYYSNFVHLKWLLILQALITFLTNLLLSKLFT